MPTPRREIATMTLDDLGPDLTRDLTHGRCFFGPGFGDDFEAFSSAWFAVRDELMPVFISKHPGRRPFAWWVCEAGAERPVIRPGLHDVQLRKPPQEIGRGCLDFTDSHMRFGYLHSDVEVDHPTLSGGPWQQPQWAFLAQRGLLSDTERQAMLDSDPDVFSYV